MLVKFSKFIQINSKEFDIFLLMSLKGVFLHVCTYLFVTSTHLAYKNKYLKDMSFGRQYDDSFRTKDAI